MSIYKFGSVYHNRPMQLTRHTDYAFRLLLYLEAHPERPVSVSQIANAYSVSYNHLSKVAQSLTAKGYTKVQRGRAGGLRLAKKAEDISLGQVVRDIEPNLNIVECFAPQKSRCLLSPACRLRSALKEATRQFLYSLDQHSLKDIAEEPERFQLTRDETEDSPSDLLS